MSLQLLVHSEGSDCLEAKEKVHVIGNRLKLLLKEVTRDIRELQKTLDITSSQQVSYKNMDATSPVFDQNNISAWKLINSFPTTDRNFCNLSYKASLPLTKFSSHVSLLLYGRGALLRNLNAEK